MLKIVFSILFFVVSTLVYSQGDISYSEDQIKLHSSFLNAKILLFKGDTTEAVKELNTLLKSEQSSIAALELSKLYLSRNNLSEALKYGKKVSGDILKEEGYLLHMLDIYKRSNELSAYQHTLQSLIDNYPENQGYFFKFVDDLIKEKEYKKALKRLTNKQKQEGVREAIVKRKYDIFMSQNKHKKAEKELQSLIQRYPKEIAYLYNLASFYSQTNQNTQSKAIYKKILAINPEDKSALAILSTSTSNNSDIGILQGLIPIVDNPESNVDDVIKRLLPYVESIDKNKDPELSSTLMLLCSKLASSHPNDAKSNTIYGDVLYLHGELEKTKIQYIRTLELNKSIFSVWNQLFTVLNRLKDYKNLTKYTQKGLNYYPNQPIVYIYNSIANSMMGKLVEGKEILEEAKYMLSNSDNITKQFYKIAQITIDIKSNNKDNAVDMLLEFENNKDKLSYEVLEKLSELFQLLGDNTKAENYKKMAKEAESSSR